MRLLSMLYLCCFFGFMPAARADSRASVGLPITVTILDYETTKAICGSRNAPSWCPPHLLLNAEASEYDAALDFSYSADEAGANGIDGEGLAKRARIQAIKSRLREQKKM